MLIGAVALAFVILSLTAVYAAQLSTQPSTGGSVGADAGNAEEFNRETRRNVRAIAVRTNHAEESYPSQGAVNDSVAAGIGNYSDMTAETYASRGVITDVRYDGTMSYGTRTLTRSNDTTFESQSGLRDWDPVSERSEVGWFVLNLNITAMPENQPFRVVVENGTTGSTEQTTYEFTRNATGASVLDIEVTPPSGTTFQTVCNPRGARSLVDLKDGDVVTSGCSATPGIDTFAGPYTVSFENGDNAVGGFSVVTGYNPGAGWPAYNGQADCTDPTVTQSQPCNTYVVWDATVTTRYNTNQLSYENTQNVSVYEEV